MTTSVVDKQPPARIVGKGLVACWGNVDGVPHDGLEEELVGLGPLHNNIVNHAIIRIWKL